MQFRIEGGGDVMLPHHNFYSHSLVCSESARPKRCRPHKKYRPNNKDRRESVFMCNVCNETMCSDCFRLTHAEVFNI